MKYNDLESTNSTTISRVQGCSSSQNKLAYKLVIYLVSYLFECTLKILDNINHINEAKCTYLNL